jgi:hypothetical protein
MKTLPKARTENLVEQNLGKETLIYDLTTHKAFNLNETLSVIYKACDGKTTIDDFKKGNSFTDDLVYLALDELKRENLLAEDYQSPNANVNRRDVIKKVGLATMFSLPLIVGLVAPQAVNAASGASNAAGNYNQACLSREVPVAGTVTYCNGGLTCVSTSRGDQRCCQRGAGITSTYYYSGEEVVESSAPVFYQLPTNPPPSPTTNECSSSISCCNGATPTGTCTYPPVPPEDEPTNDENYTSYYRNCTCRCP